MTESTTESSNSQENSKKSKSNKNSKNIFCICGHNGAALVEPVLNDLGWTKASDKATEDYKLKWTELVSSVNYKSFREGEQLVNHIPNCGLITNKLGLLMSLRTYEKSLKDTKSPKTMDMNQFVPETYIIDDPKERDKFFSIYKEGEIWIYKPTGLNQGKGISLVRDIDEFKKELGERDNISRSTLSGVKARIVQRYISNPLLLNEKKFDIRSYMMIGSTAPHLVLYCPGYIRLSMNRYSNEDLDLITHLTNQFIQKKSPNYHDVKEDTIWSMEKFNSYLNETLGETMPGYKADWANNVLEKQMQQIMLYVFQCVKTRLASRVGFFEIYGFDFMVDQDLKVWLIEVNVNPAMHVNCALLKEILPPMIEEVILIALECFEKTVSHKKTGQLLPLQNLKRFVVIYSETAAACRNRISAYSSLTSWIPPRFRSNQSSPQRTANGGTRSSSTTVSNQGDIIVNKSRSSSTTMSDNSRSRNQATTNEKRFESTLRSYKQLPRQQQNSTNSDSNYPVLQRSKSFYPIKRRSEMPDQNKPIKSSVSMLSVSTKTNSNNSSNNQNESKPDAAGNNSSSDNTGSMKLHKSRTTLEPPASTINVNVQRMSIDPVSSKSHPVKTNSSSGKNGETVMKRQISTNNNKDDSDKSQHQQQQPLLPKPNLKTINSSTNHNSQPIRNREPAPISLVQVVTGNKRSANQLHATQNDKNTITNKTKSQSVVVKRTSRTIDRSG